MGIFNCWSILRPRPAICFKNKYFGCLAYNTYIQPIRFYFIPLYMYIFICTSNHTFLNRIFGNKKIKYQRNFCKKHVSIRGLEIDHNFGLGRSDSKYYDQEIHVFRDFYYHQCFLMADVSFTVCYQNPTKIRYLCFRSSFFICPIHQKRNDTKQIIQTKCPAPYTFSNISSFRK